MGTASITGVGKRSSLISNYCMCVFLLCLLSTERQSDPSALWGVRTRLGPGAGFSAWFQIAKTL